MYGVLHQNKRKVKLLLHFGEEDVHGPEGWYHEIPLLRYLLCTIQASNSFVQALVMIHRHVCVCVCVCLSLSLSLSLSFSQVFRSCVRVQTKASTLETLSSKFCHIFVCFFSAMTMQYFLGILMLEYLKIHNVFISWIKPFVPNPKLSEHQIQCSTVELLKIGILAKCLWEENSDEKTLKQKSTKCYFFV